MGVFSYSPAFAYARNNAELAGLKAAAKSGVRGYYHIKYPYIEDESGGTTAFDDMMETVRRGDGQDVLFVETVKALAGATLDEFRERLETLEKAGVQIVSMSEPHISYSDLKIVCELVEDLLPGYQRNAKRIEAVALARMDVDIEEICKITGLKSSEVMYAMGDYAREKENSKEKRQVEEFLADMREYDAANEQEQDEE